MPRATTAAAAVWLTCAVAWGIFHGPLGPSGASRLPASTATPTGEKPASSTRTELSIGAGFVVWESARDGEWRIWRRDLERSEVTALTPREPGVRHCCAHIAPGGARLAYLAVRQGRYGESEIGELRVIDLASGTAIAISDAAQTYGAGHRAAIWHGEHRLQWIDSAGRSVLSDLATGQLEVLATSPTSGFSWLIDPTRSHATTGSPTFSPYSESRHAVSTRAALGGCEPYFSGDGKHGFWVAGAGGPIYRIDLATRAVSRLLEKNDPRIVPGASQAYTYFPMLSRAGDALVFGASPGEHDHERGDYDVFVVETDPATLDLVGPIQRVTASPGADRYPDVFLAPLELGRFAGEVPFTLDLADAGARLAKPPGTLQWSAPGAVTHLGGGRFRFEHPGVFTLEARIPQGAGGALRGRVVARPGAPPRVVEVTRLGETSIAIDFDEPVRLAAAVDATRRATLGSGTAAGLATTDNPRRLELRLSAPQPAADRLRLEGVVDQAETPRALGPEWIALPPAAWPARREGLVFLFERGDRQNLVPASGGARTIPLAPHGRAREDRHRRLGLGRGWFEPAAEDAAAIVESLRQSNEFTLELLLEPERPRQSGVVLSVARPRGVPNVELEQRGDRLIVRLLTARQAREADLGVSLASAGDGGARHVVVRYAPGELRAHLDGRETLRDTSFQRDFFQWRPGRLLIGGRADGEAAWAGFVDHLAIFDRVLPEEELRENARLALRERPTGAEPARAVEARLVARSRVPSLQEIAPYRQALVVFEYRVERSDARDIAAGSTLRVAHWAWLDGQAQAEAAAAIGTVVALRLEPMRLQPQLVSVALFDDLPRGGPPVELDVRP